MRLIGLRKATYRTYYRTVCRTTGFFLPKETPRVKRRTSRKRKKDSHLGQMTQWLRKWSRGDSNP